MISKEKILQCFEDLNEELRLLGTKGEIGIVGGAVMCLVYNARLSTRDVDAVFAPSDVIRKLSQKIGKKQRLAAEWLNDAAKGYLVDGFKREVVTQFSNLTVWAPEARYMLAMKCISARWDSSDKDDVIFLIKYLKLKESQEILNIISKYYPKNQIPAKTQFFIEEICESF